MKITVVTATYNSAATLRATLDSVRAQNYPELEYIVVDGGSTDHTMNMVHEYSDIITAFVSEPDNGIYDALNKGISMSSGEFVGFLHSDDFFADADVINAIAAAGQQCDAVYGDLQYVQRDNVEKITRHWRSKPYKPGLFKRGWMPAHPTFYLRREHYLKFGQYDTSFKQSADYELMLRMLEKHGLKACYLKKVLVKMRTGGASNVSLKNRWRANCEDARAWKKNNLKPWPFTRWLKPLSKLQQFSS